MDKAPIDKLDFLHAQLIGIENDPIKDFEIADAVTKTQIIKAFRESWPKISASIHDEFF